MNKGVKTFVQYIFMFTLREHEKQVNTGAP